MNKKDFQLIADVIARHAEKGVIVDFKCANDHRAFAESFADALQCDELDRDSFLRNCAVKKYS